MARLFLDHANVASSRPPTVHVALSSIELSLLTLVTSDPEAEPAVRQGAWVNFIDGDDSGMLRHVVPIAGYPEAAWRAVASTTLDLPAVADPLPVDEIYSARIVPPTEPPARFFRLDPFELAAGLRTEHPDALRDRNAIAARIHTLEALKGGDGPWFFVEPDHFSQAALQSVAEEMIRPGETHWGADMLLQRRVVLDEAKEARAWSGISELHAALWVTHEAPFDAGLDFTTYWADMAARLRVDPTATRLLSECSDPDLDIVREALVSPDLAVSFP
ncbi:hypothetical protein K3M67_06600 [Sphingobium sp. V4]|uniref:hypothetical protein n=1 Tax=Sphingobium sp. V4 TaxID=3038927 RepID=UPI0025580ECF|nr:hypothetical protein [Sphingobium sp. V4]WIW89622.1 hypothetical protein K3M67_06600 [Sphingobium sp. V4]